MDIESIIKILKIKRRAYKFVFVCGNGGSASTAEHFTCDLFAKGVKAICLNSNTAIMTMIANDWGYEDVFIKQLYSYANADDLVIVFSHSGRSPNIERMLCYGIEAISFLGEIDETPGQAENRHLALAHEICEGL